MSIFDTGIRPHIDEYLLKKSKERRDYKEFWSASSAGYCMRKVIFDRLQVPAVKEDARKQRVFESGHIFHEWIQRLTKDAGLSIAQELELRDEKLMVKGHFDDLVLLDGHLILYDYKTQNSRAFSYQKDKPISRFHRMQVGTYLYKLLRLSKGDSSVKAIDRDEDGKYTIDVTTQMRDALEPGISEGRLLKISKDDLRMSEQQLMWSPELAGEVIDYWHALNGYWEMKTLPKCTCADHEGGFMAREAYNDYFYDGEPCSIKWLVTNIKNGTVEATGWQTAKGK